MTKQRLGMAFVPLALAYLAVAINMTVANIALPSISTSLNADNSDLAWIVNATPLASAAVILFAGGIGDRSGRKKILIFGIALFAASAILSAVVTSPGQLIAVRAVSGVATAFVMPAALALVFDVVAKPSRPTAVGIMSATQALGSMLGPLLGGLVLLAFWWGAAFLVVVPFLLVALAMSIWLLPKDVRDSDSPKVPLDLPASILTALAGAALIFAVIEGSGRGTVSPSVWIGAAVVGVLAIVALIWWERRCENPLIDLEICRRRTFSIPIAAIFIVNFVLGGVMFMSTQYTQLVLGFSPFMAGLFLLPALVIWAATATLSGRLARTFGNRPVLAVGFVLGAVGLVIVGLSGANPNIAVLLIGMGLVGFIGVGPAQLTHTAISSFPDERRTVGSALNSLAIRFGLAFGVAVFAGILGAIYQGDVQSALSGLTSAQVDSVLNSLGGAVKVAEQLQGSAGEALLVSAREAFATGFGVTLFAAAGLLVLAAIVTSIFLPDIAKKSKTPEVVEELT